MPKITALIHVCADAPRLGRLLESLRPCDELLVIDHAADEATQKIAREHGADLRPAVTGATPGTYAALARQDWLLCLQPNEALSEGLEAALFAWKEKDPGKVFGFSVPVREESPSGWQTCPSATRLVHRDRICWTAELPPHDVAAPLLAGDLLRFGTP